MRRLFTTREALASGLTEPALEWGERTGRWRRIDHGVYGVGGAPPTPIDRARAPLVRTGRPARGRLGGVLHGLDAVTLGQPSRRDRRRPPMRVVAVDGVPCADPLTTLVDLAAELDDLQWEQALESALRKGLVSLDDLEGRLPMLAEARTPGTARIRRVLALRPAGAPPTESLLETHMVQLARDVPELPAPTRQYVVENEYGEFVARVDLAWPDPGLFAELDGEHHKGQPRYDSRRQTAVTAATGWLVARFTWSEVVHCPQATKRRLAALVVQARARRVTGVRRS